MWGDGPQITIFSYKKGFKQGLINPLLLKAPIGSNIGWGLFLWLPQTGPRAGSQMAEQPFLLTLAESGHGNGPDRKRRLSPLRSAIVPMSWFGYTDKSSRMKLDEKSRYR